MRLALCVESFFTNGEAPPLGAAVVAGALERLGHEVAAFDFNWLDVVEDPGFFQNLKQYTGVWRNPDRVNFVNNLDFLLFALFPDEYARGGVEADFLSEGGASRQFLALSMACEARAREHVGHLLRARPDGILFSTYISNVLMSCLTVKFLRQSGWNGPIWLGGPGVGLGETRRFLTEALGEGLVFPGGAAGMDAPGLGNLAPLGPHFSVFPFPDARPDDYCRAAPPQQPGSFMGTARRYLPIAPMTGCTMRCAFCSETRIWRNLKTRPPEAVVAELLRLRDELGCDTFMLNCSAINASVAWLDAFAASMKTLAGDTVPPSWWSYFRPTRELLDSARLGRLHDGGLRWATLGLESGSRRVLDAMGKATDPDDFQGILENMSASGVEVTASLLTGFPGETPEDLQLTEGVFSRWYASRPARVGEVVDVPGVAGRGGYASGAAEAGEALSPGFSGPAGVFFDIGAMIRLEPYSAMFLDPGRFGITIHERKIGLPPGLKRLSGVVSALALGWFDALSWEEKTARQRWLINRGISFGEARKGRAW